MTSDGMECFYHSSVDAWMVAKGNLNISSASTITCQNLARFHIRFFLVRVFDQSIGLVLWVRELRSTFKNWLKRSLPIAKARSSKSIIKNYSLPYRKLTFISYFDQ